MRCPKCKAALVKGEARRYETLGEHVLTPNKSIFPLRPTYLCPNKCFGEDSFFNYFGSLYSNDKDIMPLPNCHSALDSIDRKNDIDVNIIRLSANFLYHARSLSLLIVNGENDIPSKWKWPFYAIRGKFLSICYKWRHRKRKLRFGNIISS